MADVTRDDVLKLARLSRISLTEAEIEEYQKEITEILRYVEQLSSVDTKDLKPTYQVTGLKNVMRADKVIDYGYKPDELVKGSLSVLDGQLKVKRMIG